MPTEAWPKWREFYQLWDTPQAQRLLSQSMQGPSISSGSLRKLLKATKQLLPECPVKDMPADVLEAAITWKAMELLMQLAHILSPLRRHALPGCGALLSSVWCNSLAALAALSGSMAVTDLTRLCIQQLLASPGEYQTTDYCLQLIRVLPVPSIAVQAAYDASAQIQLCKHTQTCGLLALNLRVC